MADHERGGLVSGEALEAVTEALVALHVRYHGRKPASARTMMLGDDMLACMLGDVYTDVEKTMIELQRMALVHETRSAFQQAMEGDSSPTSNGSPAGACRSSSRRITSDPTSSWSSSSSLPDRALRARERGRTAPACGPGRLHGRPGPRRAVSRRR
jgi:hypothetical protein